MVDEYAFADQLKSEFRGRGAAVSGMQATSTSELMHRAEMGRDPNVNVSEQAFRENYRARQNAARTAPSRPPQGANGQGTIRQSAPSAPQNRQGYSRMAADGMSAGYTDYRMQDASRPSYQTTGRVPPRDTLSEEIAGIGRARQRAAEENSGNARRDVPPKNGAGGRNKRNGSQIRVEKTRAAKRSAAIAAAGNRQEEIEIRRGPFPVVLIALTLIAVLVIFSIVESFAHVYQTSSEIARMKAELEALKETAAGMELKLDEKNDIRTIRDIAVGELGMAEEDSMQRRFVSVSGGERIEILEAEEDSRNAGGVLFSSLGESFSRFFDRFR